MAETELGFGCQGRDQVPVLAAIKLFVPALLQGLTAAAAARVGHMVLEK